MDPRLLRYYNEELRHLREMGAEFARQFPKIASRLGMEGLEVSDPYVERMMEGFAFLAGRVQLKLDAEFPRFTQRLLDIVYPQYLAPTPSMLIAQVQPEPGESALNKGITLPRGAAMHGHASKASTTACEFRTAHALTLWPLEISQAEYFSHAAGLPLAGAPDWRKYRGGLRIRLRCTGAATFDQLALKDLRVHCTGVDDIAYRLHEQILGHTLGMIAMPVGRPADSPALLGPDHVQPAGFEDEDALLPVSIAGFEGYRVLQEYFAFPQRFLFFDLVDVGDALRRLGGTEVELILLFDRTENALLQAVDASSLALHCVPAANLFERRCDRVTIDPGRPEFHVVADVTRPMDFEVHSLTEVLGYGTGVQSTWHFLPFYNAFHTEAPGHSAYYAQRREPRLLSQRQLRDGPRSSYVGSEMFVSLVDAREAPFPGALKELGIRALCTNRDLPLMMPVGGPKGDLVLAQTAPVQNIRIVKGPSRPLAPPADAQVAWKLLNQLSLNHLSLTDSSAEQGAAALRQILRLHAPAGDAAAQRQVDGVRSAQLRPVVRRLPFAGPITFGRGVSVDIEVDELAFEGGSAFLLGGVLERFVARHVSLNGFTQLRVRAGGRGEIFSGRPRCGTRPLM